MIISASRRTDIPSFYSEWFCNRIREGFVLVPNPFNPKQVSRVRLDPEVVDCLVFWTKNPAPLLPKLERLKDYRYYFQYTLNPYDRDIESNLPALSRRIETFQRLADKIGKEKVIWRYDPVLINEKYDIAFHREAFAGIAARLEGYTESCMLGFIDHYRHIQTALHKLNIQPLTYPDIREMATAFRQILAGSAIHPVTCTAKVDLGDLGIPIGSCIDKELIERITGYKIAAKKDKNQRDICRCTESIDIGSYNTCSNGCVYCYANTAKSECLHHTAMQNPASPLLTGKLPETAVVTDRNMKSLRVDPYLF